jgi:ATP-dependent DNA ligase
MEFKKSIYKKDTKGKVRILTVSTNESTLIQESGLVDGALVKHESVCKGKNIGRSNESTPEQQAQLEAASKIETKMSSGYFYTKEEAETTEVILPMLAKDYNKEKKKITFPCYVQPKLDGMRALGKNGGPIMSRKGKLIDTMSHIQKSLDSLLIIDMLDGELYAHGKTFQENMRIIKKYRKGETENVKYHVYDMVYPNTNFSDRYALLKSIIEDELSLNIELVPTYKVNNEEDIKIYHSQFLAEGYEGTMIRWGEDGYKVNGRSSNLLKYKDFIDEVYEVVDIVPSTKNPEQGVVHCKLPDGRTFGCGMRFSHKEREEILINKEDYIGEMSETRFFEFSDDGIPRFPVCVGFRLDK